MLSHPTSPLVEIALYYATDGEPEKLTPESIHKVRTVFSKYIIGSINYADASSQLSAEVGSSASLDKVDAILRTPDIPLPLSGGFFIDNSRHSSRAKTHPWSVYEDQRLLSGLNKYGVDDWASIAIFVGNGRTKAQCSQRWFRGLDPRINKEQWTAEQDSQLVKLVTLYGEKAWTKVASEIGNRCDVQCRYRYKQLKKEPSFEEKFKNVQEEATKMTVPESTTTRKTSKSPKIKNKVQFPTGPAPIHMMQNPQWMMGKFPQFPPQNYPGVPPHGMMYQRMPQVNLVHSVEPSQVQMQNKAPSIPSITHITENSTDHHPTENLPNFEDTFHVSASGSFYDWPGLRPSPSGTSTFGISPMGSLKFE